MLGFFRGAGSDGNGLRLGGRSKQSAQARPKSTKAQTQKRVEKNKKSMKVVESEFPLPRTALRLRLFFFVQAQIVQAAKLMINVGGRKGKAVLGDESSLRRETRGSKRKREEIETEGMSFF